MTTKLKLTKKAVETLRPDGTDRLVWDTEIAGFGLRIKPSGVKSFFVMYRVGRGGWAQKRRVVIGKFPTFSVEDAREQARDWILKSKQGVDPETQVRVTEDAAVTVAQFLSRFMEEYCKPELAEGSVDNVEGYFRLHILPKLGKRRVVDVAQVDVFNLHRGMHDHPANANRILSTLSSFFNFARDCGIRTKKASEHDVDVNPCRGVEKYEEFERERYLMPEELLRLADALEKREQSDPQEVAFIRVILFSGMRRGEVLRLRRSRTDLNAGRTMIVSKTGKRRRKKDGSAERRKWVVLSTEACQILRSLPEVEDCDFFFPPQRQRGDTEHMSMPRDFWDEVRAEAKLFGETADDNFRLHDARHSFASFGVSTDGSLAIMQKLLGHSRISTTERYAHLADSPQRREADRIGGVIRAIIEGGKSKNAA